MAEYAKRTRVKVCGMTRSQDVIDAVVLGVDAIGVILHANSPRLIDVSQAKLLRTHIPAFVTMVGVFVNASAEQINQMTQQIGLDLIQLHGDETNDLAQQLNVPFIKAIRAKSMPYILEQGQAFPQARALLLDPYVPGQHGGTGRQLDSQLWPASISQPLILAGGLGPENIADAVGKLAPYAVDLNSAVEDAPGIKNADLIKQALMAISR